MRRRGRSLRRKFILIFLCWFKVVYGQTQDITERTLNSLEAIKIYYEHLEYEKVLKDGFDFGKDRTHFIGDRIKALELSLVSALILKKIEEGEKILNYILQLDPGYIFPEDEYSPKIVKLYKSIREKIVLPEAENINKEIVKWLFLKGQLKIFISEKSELPDGATAIIVHYKIEGAEEWNDLIMEEKETEYIAVVDNLPIDRKINIKLYIEMRAFSGVILGLIGSKENPLELSYTPPLSERKVVKVQKVEVKVEKKGERWYKSWWFWTMVGVVVASGMGIGGYFVYDNFKGEAPPTDFDAPLRLPER